MNLKNLIDLSYTECLSLAKHPNNTIRVKEEGNYIKAFFGSKCHQRMIII
jgi:hypothetical protein